MKRASSRSRLTDYLRPVRDIAVPPLPVLTLAEVLEEAVIWQPEAEEVIARCVAAGGKTADLARHAALVGMAYSVLLDVTRGLSPSAEQQEAVRLLTFHHRLVHEALQLGFRPDSPARERVAAHFRGGLGGPGRRLATLYQDVILGRPTRLSGTGPHRLQDRAPAGDPAPDQSLDLGLMRHGDDD